MKKLFRKAITILGSAALIGMTVGAASAAAYPAPFTSNTAIVVGANAAPSDNIAASSIASNLDAGATAVTTGTTTGETASLASGSDLMYLNDELADFLLKACASYRDDRFTTAVEMHQELEETRSIL